MENAYEKGKIAENYDRQLRWPVIKIIREQEAAVLKNIFKSRINAADRVLEVGAGTGYYTKEISLLAKDVAAQEPSGAMRQFLQKRVAELSLKNVSVVGEDFFTLGKANNFDHVIIAGVLDYIPQWQQFLDHALTLAGKTLVFTVPQLGLLGNIYSLLSKFEGMQVFTYSKAQLERHFLGKGLGLKVIETGLRTPLNKGMTLVCEVDFS